MSDARPSFWTTLPGILTGLAALVTALVAAAALFLGGSDAPPTAAGDGTGGGADGGGRTAAGSAPDVPSPIGGDGAVERSQVELRSGDYFDVDTGTARDNSVAGYDLVWNGALSLDGVRNAIVPAETDEAGCTAALRARSDSILAADAVSRGGVVCLVTDAGAVAQAVISPPDLTDGISVSLTVWRP